MIQLFSYKEKEIRTVVIDDIDNRGKIWFSAQDVFHALGLIWKGRNSLSQRNIPNEWVKKRDSQTLGGVQELIFINEQAVYKLAFSSQKNETTILFSNWVAEVLVSIREMHQSGRSSELSKLLDVGTQKRYSKLVNSKIFDNGGVVKTIEYNVKNCIYHTGTTPIKIKEKGRGLGLPSSKTKSAKDVIREIDPAVACSMAFTDSLVVEKDIEHKLAADTAKEYATPLFRQLMNIGLSYKEVKEMT